MSSQDVAGDILGEARAIRAAIDSGDLSDLATQPFRRPEAVLDADRIVFERLLTEIGEVIELVAEVRDRTAADLDAARVRKLAGRTYRYHAS